MKANIVNLCCKHFTRLTVNFKYRTYRNRRIYKFYGDGNSFDPRDQCIQSDMHEVK